MAILQNVVFVMFKLELDFEQLLGKLYFVLVSVSHLTVVVVPLVVVVGADVDWQNVWVKMP